MKILKSLVIILAMAALVAGSTGALFSDQKSIAGNTFATGTLKLTLNKSAGKPFSVSNAYPGYWTNWENMDIYNTGTLPFEAYLTMIKTSGDTVLWDALQIQLETSGGNSICHDGDPGMTNQEKVIYNGNLNAFPVQKLVSSLNYWHLANEGDGSGSPADNIRPGWSERVCQKVGLLSSADNTVQGKSVIFTETVDALQDND